MDRPRTPPNVGRVPGCTCSRLRRATRAITQLYDDALAPSGLRVTQFSLLRNLEREGPSRMSELAEKLLLDRTALTRTLEPLLAAGYVEVTRGRDARTRDVSITRTGRTAVAAAVGPWKRAQAAVARRIGRERLDALIATLAELESLHPDAAERG
jgi:DNA-binding MarR family transcriptional regulator